MKIILKIQTGRENIKYFCAALLIVFEFGTELFLYLYPTIDLSKSFFPVLNQLFGVLNFFL